MLIAVVGDSKLPLGVLGSTGDCRMNQECRADLEVERNTSSERRQGNIHRARQLDAALIGSYPGGIGRHRLLKIHNSVQVLESRLHLLHRALLDSDVGLESEVGDVTLPGNQSDETANLLFESDVEIGFAFAGCGLISRVPIVHEYFLDAFEDIAVKVLRALVPRFLRHRVLWTLGVCGFDKKTIQRPE